MIGTPNELNSMKCSHIEHSFKSIDNTIWRDDGPEGNLNERKQSS